MKVCEELFFQGLALSGGIAQGKPFVFNLADDDAPEFTISEDDIEHELERYVNALKKCRQEIRFLQKKLKEDDINEGAEILEAQLHITLDPLLTQTVEENIRHHRKNAEFVFKSLIKQYQNKFQSLQEPFFRERFKDLQDISRRIMANLKESVRFSLADVPPGTIVFAYDLLVTDVAEMKASTIAGIVTCKGASTSHSAILARAKGIPFVTGIDLKKIDFSLIEHVIVDGKRGEVIINPSPMTTSKFESLHAEHALHFTKLKERHSLPAETYDGYQVRLSANLEMVSDLDSVQAHGMHGVGLFRSEYIFLSQQEFPPEDSQFEIYKRIVEKMQNLPIVIRTFDVGGDKMVNNQPLLQKGNPFLGCRALRFLLREREIFKVQLRAILRAAVSGDVSILFPMVSSLNEIKEAKLLLKEAENELSQRGVKYKENIRIGCMIEVPSAAIITDLIATECDFLSIGTNDLVQYALAVDRSSNTMQSFYTPTHPAVIRFIKLVVTEANHCGIPVSVCGEIAADPRITPLLIGLGIRELSLASPYFPRIKNIIRNTSIVAATHLAERVLALPTAEEVMELLTEEYRASVPEDSAFYF